MQDFNLILLKLKESEKKYKCPDCDGLLIRRLSKFGNNKYWYGCSNYPNCTFTSSEKNISRAAKLIK